MGCRQHRLRPSMAPTLASAARARRREDATCTRWMFISVEQFIRVHTAARVRAIDCVPPRRRRSRRPHEGRVTGSKTRRRDVHSVGVDFCGTVHTSAHSSSSAGYRLRASTAPTLASAARRQGDRLEDAMKRRALGGCRFLWNSSNVCTQQLEYGLSTARRHEYATCYRALVSTSLEHFINLCAVLAARRCVATSRSPPGKQSICSASPHGHRTVTARSPHGHRAVTAQSPPTKQSVCALARK
jgi:hypothetical protein